MYYTPYLLHISQDIFQTHNEVQKVLHRRTKTKSYSIDKLVQKAQLPKICSETHTQKETANEPQRYFVFFPACLSAALDVNCCTLPL